MQTTTKENCWIKECVKNYPEIIYDIFQAFIRYKRRNRPKKC